MSKRPNLDERILASWRLHEEEDEDISTERLMAMVEDDTGADNARQIQALERAGLLQPKE